MIEKSCVGVLAHIILSFIIGLPGLILLVINPLLGVAYTVFLFAVAGILAIGFGRLVEGSDV